ncbi:SDR family oxidoreductase [Candidatus Roizmanbacteria bacterium]|nr:SDR family oxidoreductase [Candidatus Roizmanbacteria bacterium]
MQLKGKVVLVTGSSSGIGKAIAVACAKQGSCVVIHFRNNKQGAAEAVKQVNNYSHGTMITADLSEPGGAKRLFETLKKDSIRVDILVNNAGQATPGQFDDMQTWESQWNNIFMSQVQVTNEFIRSPHSNEIRKIVNISSVYGIPEMGNPDFPQYSAAKAAVNSFTCNLAKKLAPSVLVNAVAPGYTWTPPWEGTPQEELEACKNLTRIRRFVEPEEIAVTVVHLLQNDAITGEIIRVDGGLHLPNLR